MTMVTRKKTPEKEFSMEDGIQMILENPVIKEALLKDNQPTRIFNVEIHAKSVQITQNQTPRDIENKQTINSEDPNDDT